jgi:NADH:ubiquinone oxidoreductase subunit 4 (subunit M)
MAEQENAEAVARKWFIYTMIGSVCFWAAAGVIIYASYGV